MMKKLTIIALSVFLTFTFTGCSNASSDNCAESTAQPVQKENIRENRAGSLEGLQSRLKSDWKRLVQICIK